MLLPADYRKADMEIGTRIRALRKATGLSQEALARRANISLNVMNRIETGAVTDPHFSTLSGIAEGLGVPIGALLEEPTAPLAQAPPSSAEAVGEERRGEIITYFLSYEEPFGELPAEERIRRLERWCKHFEHLGERRSLDRGNMIERGVAAYGRGMEMSALDEVDRKRYFRKGVHTHTERVSRGELEVSEEERELCLRVNEAIAYAQNLTGEVRELVRKNEDALEQDMQRDAERLSEEDVTLFEREAAKRGEVLPRDIEGLI